MRLPPCCLGHGATPALEAAVFNVFDIVILVIAIGFAFEGFREGLIRGIINLAGLIVAVILLALFADEISLMAEQLPLPPEIMAPLTFILLFVVAMTGLHFFAGFVHTLIHMTPAGFIDSGLGTVFGVLKALLLGGLLAMLLAYSPRGSFLYNQYAGSQTAEPLRSFLAETIPFVMDAGRSIYERYHDFPVPDPNDEREERQYSI